ncbi:NhaA family sodium:proton (Na+:H+) antiporter [Neisseria wadsworthii 9715]|uniref:Na(+)/H(+) antiporter NhaA n=1 Tax=Neisseria wadsworthii 9715 TaxID=1030841 RepID=G4CRT5_9NEIS|nr:NhaA family sodium:proton (Na+:H+) antiporter [Neisseria wadsworthii 9715]QMT35467.1 Na+/H+ antiporter NhaA [Neisseria wadsworthii]
MPHLIFRRFTFKRTTLNHFKEGKLVKNKIVHFFSLEPASGIMLMIAAVLGIIVANSALSEHYFGILGAYVGGMSVSHWINDGLMAVFFLFVGLEVKRELLQGELDTNAKRILPGLAAFGGLVLPALIYALFNSHNPETIRGWAVPAATDIAFALGVLALLGSRVPASLKIFLTALAIMDDLAVIVVIALFYTESINFLYLILAGITLAALFALNKKGILKTAPYLLLGLLLWFFVLKTGIHATLAGVLLAFAIPLRVPDSIEEAPLLTWEHALENPVAFFVVPVFGFANAGVSFAGLDFSVLFEPVVLGIAAGLFVGKQIGIFSVVWATVKMGWTSLPENASWLQVYGVALLCGIGFTMSLFISLLAFTDPAIQDYSKVGVFLGSIFSGVAGYLVLRYAGKNSMA